MPPKGERKRKALDLADRVRVIELSKNNKSARSIADDFGVGKTQIQSIIKNKDNIMKDYENNCNQGRKRQRKQTPHDDVNDLTWEWFKSTTRRNMPVSGPLIQTQALKFAQDLGLNEFKASNGWLQSFVKRNNIVFGGMHGEKADVDVDKVEEWKSRLMSLCEGYDEKDIFNMDETGLFYRDTMKKTYHVKGEDCSGGKRSKERITLALCASITGEKLKPLVIGKSAKPRCFKSLKVENLPVTYRNNKKAWMTSQLMTQWLTTLDKKLKSEKRNILLFLDNAPSHPANVELSNVKVQFLPPNTTSVIQPMDQGIIQAMKLKYRKRQLESILDKMNNSCKDSSQLLKDITILEAIYWVAKSWQEVEASTITKCFYRCGFANSTDEVIETVEEVAPCVERVSQQLFHCDFMQLQDIDNELETCDTEDIDWNKYASDLLADFRSTEHEEEEEEEAVNENEETQKECEVSASEARAHVDKLKTYATQKGINEMFDTIVNLEELFIKDRLQSSNQQKKINDFFSIQNK